MAQCACGSKKEYEECCEPYLAGTALPPTAEALMRSRYVAYTRGMISYIIDTVHPETRPKHDEGSIREWSQSSKWQGMEIMATEEGGPEDEKGTVEFMVRYTDSKGARRHHELSQFRKEEGRWYFYDGAPPAVKQVKREGPKVGRNDPCTCGSGKKFKKCCG